MKKKSNKACVKIISKLIWVLFLLPINIWSQKSNLIVSNASLAEKTYLQLDRKVYTNGDTIWFKCMILNNSEHTPSILSGVLYVELIGPNETILQKKLIKIDNGIGQGSFDLDKKILKGNYLIRAYTQWNENFDHDFVFEEYIQVFTNEDQNKEPITTVKLIKEEGASDHLEVFFNPQVIDSLQKNKLTVFVTVDDKKDTLLIKKDNNKYSLDYTIKKESQFALLKIRTENEKTFTKTVVLNKDYIDLQFFPESGTLVHGLSSKVGFKALDANGKGKLIEGDIIDEKEKVLTSFKSNTLGMGSFFMDHADSTKNYYARINLASLKNKSSIQFSLPKAASAGNILTVNKQGDNLVVKALSNYLINDSIFLRISFRGMNVYEQKVNLNQGFYKSTISTSQIPEGIIAFTILDKYKNPMAERLYFNEKPQSRMKINLSTDKKKYSKRTLTNLNIQTTNAADEPIKTNTSILVINKEELGIMQSLRQNILSYFLMDSELKGNIENPGYYFKNNSSMHEDLEVLMLTQGWSKYNYSKPYQSLSINPEKMLTVSGKVNNLFSEKKGRKDIQLTMITSGKNKSIYNQVTDSLGRFKFNLNDEYGKAMEVLFQTSKKSNKKTTNCVVLDEKKIPPILFEHDKSIEQIDSIVEVFIKKSVKQKDTEEKFKMQSGSVLLKEVNINAYNITPNRKKVMERYGKPQTVISGKAIRDKEKKWSYGLYSILLFNYPDKVRIERTPESIPEQYLYATVNNMPTLVVIDGIPVTFYDYAFIPAISPSEVTSFEIIENADDFARLYCEVHREISSCEILAPNNGNVIAIYTHAGVGLSGAYEPKGLTQTVIPVFASPKEFYAPKYENMLPDDWKHADIRTLIHWQPIVKTDNTGKAITSFYNTDNKGEMTIIAEAISEDGEIGYKELNYEVND
jgi:hypothetical protein